MSEAVERCRLGGLYWPWHRWFAWYPVFSGYRGWVWLRFVERRWTFKDWLPAGCMHGWDYR